MSEEIRIVNPLNNPHWDDLILSHPDCTFFHSSAWARVLVESYGYKPLYFAVFSSDRLCALLPVMEVNSFLTGNKGVSLPFTDYSNPLTAGDIQTQALLTQALEYGRQNDWKFLELRMENSFLPSSLPALSYIGHILDLDGRSDRISSRFRSSTRRNIRKALHEGVEIKNSTSLDSIKEFYRLNCLTRKEHGLPPQPYEFFKNIHKHVLLKGFGSVILASYRGKSIAGSVFFHFGRKAIFKYGAFDRKYQRFRANNLVMWEAIRLYAQKGYQSLCFGRTEMENLGLLQFKSGWGAIEHPLRYCRYDFKKEAFVNISSSVTTLHNKIFRKMPVPLLKKIGAALYRHAG
jgi:hypothetical protein